MKRILNIARSMSTSALRNGKLDGKTAVVTASTEGIGYAIAQKLGQDGAHVLISSRKQDKVDSAVAALRAQDLNASGLVCHVSESADRTKLFDKVKNDYGGLDILVLNAGVNPYFGPTLDTPENAFDKIFETNVKSTLMWIQKAVPLMKSKTNASIVIVSSIAAFAPFEFLGVYSISKTALVAMTKALAPELGAKNIRINCLAPGIIKTKFSGALWQDQALEKQMLRNVPLGRLGTPDDCGGMVSFLSSDEATYITGETVVVAGGMPSRM